MGYPKTKGEFIKKQAWQEFREGDWEREINVRNFIQTNCAPHEGGAEFLAPAANRTSALMRRSDYLLGMEREFGGVLGIGTRTVTSLTSYKLDYLDKEQEIIVGLQTNRPLRRGVNPFGGPNMTRKVCEVHGYQLSPEMEREFQYRTTHSGGIFRVYTGETRAARHCGIVTGLLDAYGKGCIIGDYRRVALYGVDRLVEKEKKDKAEIGKGVMDTDRIRQLEELYQQITFLRYLRGMAALYGFDLSRPAENTRKAVRWLYFGYLGSIKEQSGTTMSLGRVSTFLDIYFECDLANGPLMEQQVQEVFDDFVVKPRMAHHLHTPDYNELLAGDPMWITESVGGMGEDDRVLVTKNSFHIFHTLYNLGSSAEPNLIVLWSDRPPEAFKRFAIKVSCETDVIQYENDDIMCPKSGDDYGIACCVSTMQLGKNMQLFGAWANLAKLLLMSLNGGRDEESGDQIAPVRTPYEGEYLGCEAAVQGMAFYHDWLAKTYISTMGIVHYIHNKYTYERMQMTLYNTDVHRFMAFEIAGLSVLTNSLPAIKHAKVRYIRDENGLIREFETVGEYPTYGNDDDHVDSIAQEQVRLFFEALQEDPAYRNAEYMLSILTIISNVVYGKKTEAIPDERKAGEPFALGANPIRNREKDGTLVSLNSIARLSYNICRDGISSTFSIISQALGHNDEGRHGNLIAILNGYFLQKAHHINVNVLSRKTLMGAHEHPEQCPNLTIRVSGYAVNFRKPSREQQREVISRISHRAT